MTTSAKPRLGISACLLGREVRWDGRHKLDPLVVEALGPHVEWVPVCPELELGLGVPREPIRLVGRPQDPALLGERSGADHTGPMSDFAARRAEELAPLGLRGWVTKQGSPSCGLAGVRVYPTGGEPPLREGVGAFVRVLRDRFPRLPIEEEERLHDPAARERFLERVREYDRWCAADGREG